MSCDSLRVENDVSLDALAKVVRESDDVECTVYGNCEFSLFNTRHFKRERDGDGTRNEREIERESRTNEYIIISQGNTSQLSNFITNLQIIVYLNQL